MADTAAALRRRAPAGATGYPALGATRRPTARASWARSGYGRGRRQLPRHRAQRDDRSGGLRADRPMWAARGRGHLDRPRGWLAATTNRCPRRRASPTPPIGSRSPSPSAARAAHRPGRPSPAGGGLSPMAARAVRAAQGRHHRLVGRRGRRPRVRSVAVSPAGQARRADAGGHASNCNLAAGGDGVQLRMLKPHAFMLAGRSARRARRNRMAASLASGWSATSGRGRRSWRRAGITAARRDVAADRDRDARARPRRDRRGARGGADRVPPGRPELRAPGRRPDRPPVLRLLRPAPDPAPHGRGAGRRGPIPDPRGRLPLLSAGPRRGRAVRLGSCSRTRPASASRPTRRARRSSCGSCHVTTRPTSARPPTRSSSAPPRRSRACCACSARSTARRTTWCSTRAPLRERVDETYHWHWEIHPRLREIAGLELGTGLPVNPVAPEEAARSCSRRRATEKIETGVAVGPRSWDEFPVG